MRYAGELWLQTLAGLGLLGLIGGWTLIPFRRDDRPWLWLCAPVAGIAVFSLLMTGLCRMGGASVAAGLAVVAAVNLPLTLVVLLRWLRGNRSIRSWLDPLTVVLVATVWATFACNRASLDVGEPALFTRDGSDMVGYAQMADWFLNHPGVSPTWAPAHPEQAFTHILYQRDPRWGTFLLLSSAASLRGTTALMSYDFLSGVVLAAGVLALAGAYASTRAGVVLLTAAGLTCLWLPISRSGYLGKLTCYPACVWLCSLYLHSAAAPTRTRWGVLTLLASGVGLCHTLSAMLCLVGLAAGPATIFAMTASLKGCQPSTDLVATLRQLGRTWLRHTALYLVMAAPLGLLYRWLGLNLLAGGSPLSRPFDRVLGIALGVDGLGVPVFEEGGGVWMLLAVVASGMVLWGAWRKRSLEAGALASTVWVLPLAFFPKTQGHLYQVQGYFFPLGMAAAATTLSPASAAVPARWWRGVTLAAAVLALMVRLPRTFHTWERYVRAAVTDDHRFTQSEINALLAQVDRQLVRLATTSVHAGLVFMQEFAARNQTLQYSPYTWRQLFDYTGWQPPEYALSPDFVVCSEEHSTPVAAVVAQSRRYRVLDPRRGVMLLPRELSQRFQRDEAGRESFWQGSTPSTWEALNCTGETVPLVLTAVLKRGPDHPRDRELAVQVRFEGLTCVQRLARDNEWTVQFPLGIPPGAHELVIRADDPQGDAAATGGEQVFFVRELQLVPVHDQPDLVLSPESVPHRLERDGEGRSIFWQGAAPTRFEVLNWSGRTQLAVLTLEAPRGPNHADPAAGQLHVGWLGRTSTHEVRAAEQWRLRVPLPVPPGRHDLRLWSDDPAVPLPNSPDPRDRLFLVRNVILEPTSRFQEITWTHRTVPHGLERDAERQPIFWQGAQPTIFELHNPWDEPVEMVLQAEAPRGPNHPARGEGTLHIAFHGETTLHTVKATERWQLTIPLRLPPGRHELRLWTEEPAVPTANGRDPRDRLFLVRKLALEPAEAETNVAARPSPDAPPAR